VELNSVYPPGYTEFTKETDVAFVNFMSSRIGRAVRIALGSAMIAIGIRLAGGWLALSIIGIVPVAAGAFGVCLIAPLFHRPLRAPGSQGA